MLEALAAAGAKVTAIGASAFRLAVESGLAADCLAFGDARLLGLFAPGGSCELLAGFDLCIVYGRERDPVMADALRRSGVARVVSWPSHPQAGMHIVDHLLGAVAEAGFPAAGRRPALAVPDLWRERAEAWLRERSVSAGFVALHPGSGGRAKRWPVAQFAALAERLGRPVVWLLGPAEAEDAEARRLGERVGVVADGLPLATLGGLLAQCRAYVGNDSGVTHLAAAVGAPTVAIFGPTEPAVWAPRGEHVTVLGGPGQGGLAGVSVEAVAEALGQAAGARGRDR